jgi:hypothetical protein
VTCLVVLDGVDAADDLRDGHTAHDESEWNELFKHRPLMERWRELRAAGYLSDVAIGMPGALQEAGEIGVFGVMID